LPAHITFMNRKIQGKRPAPSAQTSAADGIINARVVQSEEVPLSPLPATAAHPPVKHKPYGRAITATILLFTPFLCSITLYFLGLIFGSVLPFDMLISLLILNGILSVIGGLFLYLAARKTNYLRRAVGWVSLALLVLQIDFGIVFLGGGVAYLSGPANLPPYILSVILSALLMACMVALCVFSVLVLLRLTRKKKPKELAL